MNLNLRYLDGSPLAEKSRAWQSIKEHLFNSLKDDLKKGVQLSFNEMEAELCSWKPFVEDEVLDREEYFRQWMLMRAMVWCATQAPGFSDTVWSEIEPVFTSLSSSQEEPQYEPQFLEFVHKNSGWILECIRLFVISGRQSALEGVKRYPRQVHFVTVIPPMEDIGRIFRFDLAVVTPGSGQAFYDPANCLNEENHFESDFFCSMQTALDISRNLIEDEGGNILCDGIWRVQKEDSFLFPSFEGESASGAALRGWYFALKNQRPDKEVIIASAINNAGRCLEVDGIEAKVRAIAKDGRFDTIGIVQKNLQYAKKGLKDVNPGSIRLVDIESGKTLYP